MRLDKILENIKASDSSVAEKTASYGHTTPPRDQLMAALNEAAYTKTASAPQPSPADDLMKIAADVAATEQEMAFKEAHLLGRAFADAVVSRVGEWQSAAQVTKTAAAYDIEPGFDGGFDKFASDNGQLIKEAAEVGYLETRGVMEKVAAAEYERGYNDTLDEVQKIAANEFAKAAQLTSQILDVVAAG